MQATSITETDEAIVSALRQVELRIHQNREEIEEFTEAIEALQSDQKNLSTQRAGLRSYLQSQGVNPDEITFSAPATTQDTSNVVSLVPEVGSAADTETPGFSNLTHMKRADAVEHVLRTEDRPMGRVEIQEQLALAGRGEDAGEVSLALTGLKRTKRAYQVSRGLWAAMP